MSVYKKSVLPTCLLKVTHLKHSDLHSELYLNASGGKHWTGAAARATPSPLASLLQISKPLTPAAHTQILAKSVEMFHLRSLQNEPP